jgi:hypothetical protein
MAARAGGGGAKAESGRNGAYSESYSVCGKADNETMSTIFYEIRGKLPDAFASSLSLAPSDKEPPYEKKENREREAERERGGSTRVCEGERGRWWWWPVVGGSG